MNARSLLNVRDLTVRFPVYGGVLRKRIGALSALESVSLDVRPGETLGIVGESGCGKSTLARASLGLLRFIAPRVEIEGGVDFHANGRSIPVLSMSRRKLRPYRAHFQMVFQDPFSSLNPRITVGRTLMEPLDIHFREWTRDRKRKRVFELLDRVGIARDASSRYPHEFSGGQRQRIAFARALVTHPRLVVADEPVSALDVSIQAQILNLMRDLQNSLGLTYLFIAHDLSVVRHLSSRIAVMYLGRVVERGDAETVCRDPAHPYTRMLIDSIPRIGPRMERRSAGAVSGETPDLTERPKGCVFRGRCPIERPECALKPPDLERRADGRWVACPYGG
jgi:oligopeptide/dipeptide ABC transporter ATP-binding protein